MSYVPSHAGGLLGQPESLVFIPMTQSTSQAPVVDTAINLDAAQVQFGSWSVSITSDIITLPSGYYYFVEACAQAYYTSSASGSDYLTTQIYDETNTQYIGVKGTCWRSSGEDTQLESRDEKCRAFIDCTSSGITVSIKTQAKTSNMNRVNYSADIFTNTSGSGRVIIWRLDP